MDEPLSTRVQHENELTYQIRMHELEAQNLELSIKSEELIKENAVLIRENNQLKRMPLFVAAVVDVFPTGEIYLRQQGNNQEYLTVVPEDLQGTIQAGSKVAVNNSLSIVKLMPTTYDTRVRVMELEECPEITFEHIGGLTHEIEEVREAVEYPLTRPEVFTRVGVDPPKGILLYGPPGTGKTLIAKAIAHNAKATFIRMSGSELVHKFIGEGAQLVRDLFELARDKAPSIVFIDEIDAIGMTRTNDGTSGSAEVQRTMMQLLAEMDGFDTRGEIRIMAATNRVDMLDAALLRPGRFDRIIEIPLPDTLARREILRIHTRKMTLASPIDFDLLVTKTEGMTGAELQAICREAGMIAVRKEALQIEQENFITAISKIRDDVTSDERMFL